VSESALLGQMKDKASSLCRNYYSLKGIGRRSKRSSQPRGEVSSIKASTRKLSHNISRPEHVDPTRFTIPISRPIVGDEELKAVSDVLRSGMLAQGQQVARFEAEFARVTGARHAVATSSGTTALHLALLAHGIGPGDEVITSAFTFIASVNAIMAVGAHPVLVDIGGSSYNIDCRLVERAVNERTKAILPVHLYGLPCDMDQLTSTAKRWGIAIIEDAAQAIGASYRGRPIGSTGTACFSLYATKNITAGEGGVIATDDDVVADSARLLRQHGMRRRYCHETYGYNFRMTDIAGTLAAVQLGRLTEINRRRSSNAELLSRGIKSATIPEVPTDRVHAWHQYTVRVPYQDRQGLVARLAESGIEAAIYYPHGAHKFPHVSRVVGKVDLPVTDRVSREVLSLPVHPSLAETDVNMIVREMNHS
jgi:perosamine synthetase